MGAERNYKKWGRFKYTERFKRCFWHCLNSAERKTLFSSSFFHLCWLKTAAQSLVSQCCELWHVDKHRVQPRHIVSHCVSFKYIVRVQHQHMSSLSQNIIFRHHRVHYNYTAVSHRVTQCHTQHQVFFRCWMYSARFSTDAVWVALCHNMPQCFTRCTIMLQCVTNCHNASQCHIMSHNVTKCHNVSQVS